MNVGDIIKEARLTEHEFRWTVASMDQIVPRDGRPMLTSATTPYRIRGNDGSCHKIIFN